MSSAWAHSRGGFPAGTTPRQFLRGGRGARSKRQQLVPSRPLCSGCRHSRVALTTIPLPAKQGRYETNQTITLPRQLGLLGDARQPGQRCFDLGLRMLVVLHRSGKVAVVRREIEEPMPTEIEEDRSCLAGFSGLERLVDGDANRVRRLRRGNDALRAPEEHRRLERRALLDGGCLDQPLVEQ